MTMTSLEYEDLKHRYQGTFVLCKDASFPGQSIVGNFYGYLIDDDGNPNKIRLIQENPDKQITAACDSIIPVAPENKYVNLCYDGRYLCYYIFKSGARHYKKGFSLSGTGGPGPMFHAVNPLRTKVKLLNAITEDRFFGPQASLLKGVTFGYSGGEIVKIPHLYYLLARQAYLGETYPSIKAATELVPSVVNTSKCLAISKDFCLGLSSSTEYDFDLYSGLFHLGYLRDKTFYVTPELKQDLHDFLIRSNQGQEYGINTI